MAQVTKEMLRERFFQAGLEPFWPQIERVLRPAIAVKSSHCSDESLPIGASKRGGAPDLPVDFVWPERGGEPCQFLCQINLTETRMFDIEGLLPTEGLLSFFVTDYAIGVGEGRINGDPVYFFPSETLLERRSHKPNEERTGLFGTTQFHFESTWSVPDNSSKLNFLGRRSEAEKAYEDVIGGLSDLSEGGFFEAMAALAVVQGETTLNAIFQDLLQPSDKPFDPLLGCVLMGGDCLLGHPNDYQGDQEPDCELIYQGVVNGYWDDYPENYATIRGDMEQRAFENWVSLFDTSDDVGVFSLSYCIRRDDLARQDFSKTILVAVN
nr:DUF1963 domain-containing protein [Armatimonas sp.]